MKTATPLDRPNIIVMWTHVTRIFLQQLVVVAILVASSKCSFVFRKNSTKHKYNSFVVLRFPWTRQLYVWKYLYWIAGDEATSLGLLWIRLLRVGFKVLTFPPGAAERAERTVAALLQILNWILLTFDLPRLLRHWQRLALNQLIYLKLDRCQIVFTCKNW